MSTLSESFLSGCRDGEIRCATTQALIGEHTKSVRACWNCAYHSPCSQDPHKECFIRGEPTDDYDVCEVWVGIDLRQIDLAMVRGQWHNAKERGGHEGCESRSCPAAQGS